MRARRVRERASNIFILSQTGVMKSVLSFISTNNTLSTTFYTVQDKNIRPRSHNHTDAAKTQININLIVLQARDNFTTLSYYAETDDY